MPSARAKTTPASTAGSFAATANPKSRVTPSEDRPPLQDYRIVGFSRRIYQSDPQAPQQPGGTCWHCGTGIMNCVEAKHQETGEQIIVGLDCAERCGLDREGIRRVMREKYANERMERSRAASDAARAEWDRREAEVVAEHGEHGSESRFDYGCRCDPCRQAAPHGNIVRLETGCFCTECVTAGIDSGGYVIQQREMLFDATTGAQLHGRVVSSRFGPRWAVSSPPINEDDDDGYGGSIRAGTQWYPYRPKRRSTLAQHGVVEAEVEMLCERKNGRHGQWFLPVHPMAVPTVDIWGVPLAERPADA